jgi:hypothetical protein
VAREAGKGLWGHSTGPALQLIAPHRSQGPHAAEEAESDQDDALIMVYVTKTGKKYHAEGCRHLSKSKIAQTLADAKTRYTACKVCLTPK